MKKIVFSLGFIFLSVLMFGQVPATINYQAVLRDASGNLMKNKNVTLQFKLASGSLVYYVETQSVTTDDYGTVNLKIGTGTATMGKWADIPWTNANVKCTISIDNNGSWDLLGTEDFSSVPYAEHSATSPVAVGFINVDNTKTPPTATLVSGYGINDVSYTYLFGQEYILVNLVHAYLKQPIVIITPKAQPGARIYSQYNCDSNYPSFKIYVNLTDSLGNQIVNSFSIVVYNN